jgi:formylglycine-generating enzyme required for sulfatase activity
MHGYLWEFVADSWHENFTGAPADARPWEAGEANLPRVIRGGSWRDRHELLRSTTRWPIPDHARSDAVGFRCLKAKVGREIAVANCRLIDLLTAAKLTAVKEVAHSLF